MDGYQPLENNMTPPSKSGGDYTLAPKEILPCVHRRLIITLLTRMKSKNYIVIVPVRTKEEIVNTKIREILQLSSKGLLGMG